MALELRVMTPEAAWKLYTQAMRSHLTAQSAEPEAIDTAIAALQPIFLHHCKLPDDIGEPRTSEEAFALMGAYMRDQVAGLLSELAYREVVLWRLRQTALAAEPVPRPGLQH